MSKEELEQLAAQIAPLPDGLTFSQQYLFFALRALYAQYRSGGILKEDAKKEKAAILLTYKKMLLWERVYQKHTTMLRTVQRLETKIKESKCPICQGLYRALCGLNAED